MINNLPAFVPYLIPQYPSVAGLRVFIGAGNTQVTDGNVFWPGGFINVQPLAINYIYLNLASGQVLTNTTGFTGNVYIIALVITSSTEVVSLQDVRPDVFGSTGGGGGGITSAADTVVSLTTSTSVVISPGVNYFFPTSDGTTQILPSPTGLGGQWAKFLKRGAGAAITIIGGELGPWYLSNQGQYVIYETDGNLWDIIGNN
jgi:hypothetical protein